MNVRPEQKEFDELALLTGIDPSFIEKDWFVTQVVAAIASFAYEGFLFVFGGGTALSKAHNLIKRFSEDVDFKVIAPSEHSRASRSKFKHILHAYLRSSGFAIGGSQITAKNENRHLVFEFQYPSYYPKGAALRPHLLMECSIRTPQAPGVVCPVSSFINLGYGRPPEVGGILCINPTESAADKLSALAWRIPARSRTAEQDDPALVRHLHDLAVLQERVSADENFPLFAVRAMKEDERRLPALADISMEDRLRQMLEILENDPEYPAEYETYVRGVSYAEAWELPDFRKAMASVRQLVKIVSLTQ